MTRGVTDANIKKTLVGEAVNEAGLSLLHARPDIEFEVITDNLQARMEEKFGRLTELRFAACR